MSESARQLGIDAYHEGQPCVPAHCPALLEMLDGPPSDRNINLLLEWRGGWMEAQQEQEEYDIAEHAAAAKAEAYNEQVLIHGHWRPDPEDEREDAHMRWLEDLEYKNKLKKQEKTTDKLSHLGPTFEDDVVFNPDGSVTLSADWIKRNAEK